MANVLNFPTKAPKREPGTRVVFVCSCGNCSFYVSEENELYCTKCDTPIFSPEIDNDAIGWRLKKDYDVPKEVPELEGGSTVVSELLTSEAAIRSVLRRADKELTAHVIIIQNSGGVHTWGEDVDTQERKEWFERRIQDARNMLFKDATPDPAEPELSLIPEEPAP